MHIINSWKLWATGSGIMAVAFALMTWLNSPLGTPDLYVAIWWGYIAYQARKENR